MARKIGRKILAFIAVVTIGQVYTLQHYNSILTTKGIGSALSNTASLADARKAFANLEKIYPLTALSADSQYAAYVDNQNVLHIKDLGKNRQLCTAQNTYSVDYIEWIRNDSVFVGERIPGGSLLLKRVDANTGAQQTIHTFSSLLSSDDIKKIAYSAETNDTYVLIGNQYSTVVYHFDTNGNLSSVPLGERFIKNIAVTQTGDTLYFEDYASGSFNVGELPLQGQIQILHYNSALISVVGNILYYGTVNSDGLVTAVYKDEGGTSHLVETLHTPTLAAKIRLS